MNSKNCKTSDFSQIINKLTEKIYLKRNDKNVALSNLRMYYTWKDLEKSYKNTKYKISATAWNEELELPDGSYSVSDIQDYFEYMLKTMAKCC